MARQTIGVFFGSRSTEHDVSIVTALASVIMPLKLLDKYEVVPIYIAKDGRWYSYPKLADIATFTSGDVDNLLAKLKPLALEIGSGLRLVEPGLRNKIINIDVAFPATHGTHGEDGELMAVFELAGIPYVGCNMEASVIAMDKILAKQVAASHDIPVTKFISYRKPHYEARSKDCIQLAETALKYPLFVKPPHLGSSIGITRVTNSKGLANAIEVALHYDDSVLIEEAVQNLIEVTLPIMGNDDPQPALLEQPLTSAEDFFDFDTKYLKGGKKGKSGAKGAQGYSLVPANLPKKIYDLALETGLEAYKAIGCSGIARVDMLIDSKSGRVYFNEINPLPGSLYSHNWNKAGVSNVKLVERLIELAFDKFTSSQATTVFETSYLQQF